MITRLSAVLAAALIFGSASVASAATTHKVARHHYHLPQGVLMLLENAPAFGTGNGTNFQDNWDISY